MWQGAEGLKAGLQSVFVDRGRSGIEKRLTLGTSPIKVAIAARSSTSLLVRLWVIAAATFGGIVLLVVCDRSALHNTNINRLNDL